LTNSCIHQEGAAEIVKESELRSKLEAARFGKPLRVKQLRSTAPDLHLGTRLLRKLKHFQDLGTRSSSDWRLHGMIGDPTGRSATRPR